MSFLSSTHCLLPLSPSLISLWLWQCKKTRRKIKDIRPVLCFLIHEILQIDVVLHLFSSVFLTWLSLISLPSRAMGGRQGTDVRRQSSLGRKHDTTSDKPAPSLIQSLFHIPVTLDETYGAVVCRCVFSSRWLHFWSCRLPSSSSFFLNEKLQLQERRLRRRRPTTRWKKCNPVRKKKTQL